MTTAFERYTGELEGLELIHRGKVRDTYRLPENRRLVVTTDRVSIFDFVLGAIVPEKGYVLNALTHFFLTELQRELNIPTHLEAAGIDQEQHIPEQHNMIDLLVRSMVVRELTMIPVEFIARGHLTGSGLASYKQHGHICGHSLPDGLEDGDGLPRSLDTPTTKATGGHDEPLNAETIRLQNPEATARLIAIYRWAYTFLWERGIVLADTKLEFGLDAGELVLGDEVLTPDSSRFWDRLEWEGSRLKRPRKAPNPLDKQLIRNWGKAEGIDQLDPADPDHRKKVSQMEVPPEIVRALRQTYRYIFWRITGQRLERYIDQYLSIRLPVSRPRLTVIFGSESDITDEVRRALLWQKPLSAGLSLRGHVISCHRNDPELDRYVREQAAHEADVILAIGGKAFALPGVLKAKLQTNGFDIPVVGVGMSQPDTEAFEAARLSIKQLPGETVVMDLNGEPYMGIRGLRSALDRIINGEMPPPKPAEVKPPKFNIAL